MYTQSTRNTASALYGYNGKYAFRNNKPLLAENPYDVSYEDISAPREKAAR